MRIKSLLGCLAATLLIAPSIVGADQQLRITAQAASIHSKADASSQVLFVARAAQTFKVVASQGDWIEITTEQGLHGFVLHSAAEVIQPAGAAPKAPAPQAAAPQAPAPQAPALQAPPDPQAPPPNPDQPTVDHNPIGCIVAGKFPKLDAGFMPTDVARARVYFKAGGTAKWYYVDMKTGEGRYVGILPKPKKTMKKLDYYVSGLSKASLEGRTQDYSPDVVEKESECGSKPKAAYVPNANVAISGGIPEGFEAAGILTAGSTAGAAGAVAAGHTTALLVGGGVVAAGGATAVVVHNHNSGPPPCTPNGFTFTMAFGFQGSLSCPQSNPTQQVYTVTNKTCQTLTITGLGVAYAFSGQCSNPNSTVNLSLNGATSIPTGKQAVIRTGAPAGQARTFCCPTPPCAVGTCSVQETFTVQTSQGSQTLTNNFSVAANNDCPGCNLPHADGIVVKPANGQAGMCFEGESVQ